MSALVIHLRPVRNAIEQAERLGSPESRRAIVARVVDDIRQGFHPFRIAQELHAQRLAQRAEGAA